MACIIDWKWDDEQPRRNVMTMGKTAISDDLALTRRQLVFRDSLTFLGLSLVVLALFFATLFLFRSFTQHRAVLAERWLNRGRADLSQGRPAQAVSSLEVALDYAPDNPSAELLLAQALAAAGRAEEANNYFIELWEMKPGSGLINLELARLAARKGEQQQAINDYRAAIYGTWEGDGATRRLAVRLELARYLLDQGQTDAARVEMLVAGGNAAGDAGADMMIASLLERAGDRSDALHLYERAAHSAGGAGPAVAAEGRVAYQMGDFEMARRLLPQALNGMPVAERGSSELEQMLRTTEQVLALSPAAEVPDGERVRRISAGRAIVQRHVEACMSELSSRASDDLRSSKINTIAERLTAAEAEMTRRSLLGNRDRQSAAIRLTYDAAVASDSCGAERSVEDRALTLLAQYGKGLGN